MTVAGCLQLLFAAIILAAFARNEKTENFFISICLKHDQDQNGDAYRDFKVGIGFASVTITITGLVFLATEKYVKSRSAGQMPPPSFGRYQRNIVTFKETVVYNTVMCIGTLASSILCAVSRSLIPLIASIAITFAITLSILIQSLRVPSLSTSNQIVPQTEPVFYIQPPSFLPRRDSKIHPNCPIAKSRRYRPGQAPSPKSDFKPIVLPRRLVTKDDPVNPLTVTGLPKQIIMVKPCNVDVDESIV